MTLDSLVTSLELSKKLKDLHLNYESLFAWYHGLIEPFVEYKNINYLSKTYQEMKDFAEICPAFTAQEIGQLLGKAFFNINKNTYNRPGDWFCYYQPESGTDNSYTFVDDNLANIMAKILIAKINEDGL